MSSRWARRLQYAAACALVVVYDALSHYSNSTGSNVLGAVLALAPLTMVTLVVAWRSQPPPAAIGSSAAIAAVFFYAWPLVEKKFSLFCLLQETSVYVLLGLTFARSLRHQQVALCTQLAAKVHGPLSAQEVAYTRKITAAWSMFFVLIAVVSVLLYARTPLRVWSIYINFCVLPLICAMFIGEYLVRGKVLPTTQRVGWLASVRVYFAHQQ